MFASGGAACAILPSLLECEWHSWGALLPPEAILLQTIATLEHFDSEAMSRFEQELQGQPGLGHRLVVGRPGGRHRTGNPVRCVQAGATPITRGHIGAVRAGLRDPCREGDSRHRHGAEQREPVGRVQALKLSAPLSTGPSSLTSIRWTSWVSARCSQCTTRRVADTPWRMRSQGGARLQALGPWTTRYSSTATASLTTTGTGRSCWCSTGDEYYKGTHASTRTGRSSWEYDRYAGLPGAHGERPSAELKVDGGHLKVIQALGGLDDEGALRVVLQERLPQGG